MKRLILIALALFISACAAARVEKNANAYINRGNAYARKGLYDKAISDYNKAIELDPSNAKGYVNRGIAYFGKGQHEQAISNFTKAIRLKSDYAKAYNNRANAYASKGQYGQAISDCNIAIEINPRYALAYVNRGLAYFGKGQYDKAISDCNKAIELDPKFAKAYTSRGLVYGRKGQYDKAWKDVHKAESLGYQVPPTFLKNLRVASKKTPCKPFRKKIDCEYFDHWQCREELEKFGNTFIEQFNLTRKKYTYLTVNTGDEEFYNLKYSIDFNIPALYVDITHCVNGEVTEKKRINLGGEYR
jgi:tetratricopeptide (TPR) repeat protein